jgi:gliding motility-associated-like protein
MKPFLVLLLCLVSISSRAQITAPDTVCQYDTVTLSTTYDAETYTWTDSTFSVDQYYNLAAPNRGAVAMDGPQAGIFNDNGHWYEIKASYTSPDYILRGDLGTDPTHYPSSYTVLHSGYAANIDGVYTVRDDATGNWYSFAGGFKAVYRYSYGTSLGNTPAIDSIPAPTLNGNTTNVVVGKFGNEWVGFMNNNHKLIRMDIGTNITNTPVFTQVTTSPYTDVYVKVVEEGGNYYLLGTAISSSLKYVLLLSLGTNIHNNTPSVTDISNRGVLQDPIELLLVKDCNKFTAVGVDNNNLGYVNMDFGSSITNMPVYTFLAIRPTTPTAFANFTYNDTLYFRYEYSGNYYLWPGLFYASTTTTVYNSTTNKHVFADTGLHTIGLHCNEGSSTGIASFCKDIYVKPSVFGTLTGTRDTGVCAGNTMKLDVSGYNATGYLWSTGATTSAITNLGAGTYWVKVSGAPGCANGIDTIKVKGYPAANANLGPDTSACVGGQVPLRTTVFVASSNYLWSTGATTSTILVPGGNAYSLRVTTADGCVGRDTINVAIAPLPVVALTDTALCPDDTISIHANAQPAGSTYLWSTGSTKDSAIVTGGHDYWLEVTDKNSCVKRDTVAVTTHPAPNANLGPDFSVCADKDTVLHVADSSNYTYLWNTGSTTASTTATPGSKYFVTVTDQHGCVATDIIYLDTLALPIVNLGDDKAVCAEGSEKLASPITGTAYKYLWSTGETTASINIHSDHTYSLTVTDEHGCTGKSNTISVTAVPHATIDIGPRDTLLSCTEHSLLLPVYYAANGNNYLWSDGSKEPQLKAGTEGTYYVAYSNKCYTVSDTITIREENCSLWFPGGFTPNGDGKNDVAHVLGDLTYVSKYRLTIYNRWGRLVYSTNDMYSGWDGSYKGTAQDVGTYNYLIRYTYKGHEQKLDGAITLVR